MKKFLSTVVALLCAVVPASAQTDTDKDVLKDMTEYIVNPSFEEDTKGWSNYNLQCQSNNSFALKEGGHYMERWVSQGNSAGYASITQTIKNLPMGKYRLTAAAQNLSQDKPAQKNTGVTIFAGDVEAEVYTPDEYSLTFSSNSGDVMIGFVSLAASGNWIAVDNFRLYLVGYADTEVMMKELSQLIAKAEELSTQNMSSNASGVLAEALDAAKQLGEGSEDGDIMAALTTLQDAITVAQTAVAAYSELTALMAKCQTLLDTKMEKAVAIELQTAIDMAGLISPASTDSDIAAATKALNEVYENANTSSTAYTALVNAISEAEAAYDAGKEGAEALKNELDKAKEMAEKAEANAEEVTAELELLSNALLAFNIANATPGTGTAPQVSSTHPFVPTGATQALVRAAFKGSNLLEKGVCWSTEHEPTVLDNRTTKSFTLNGTIFHIKGMKPATVYYVRAYAMNKNYNVAYGDEIKIVTNTKGTATWTWDGGAPTEEANARCRTAMKQTIEYFNEWTGIKGFQLSGHYGAQTPTADCSYGGWMRIGPNASYQAIGTVLHETGHGVGVGTTDRWWDTNVHNWEWLGREANTVLRFLENKDGAQFVGDQTHGWGQNATYDWLVNGADKDRHEELQYIGGMCIMRGLFIDGLCPTSSDHNGIASYTYNFDDGQKYYLMSKSTERGLGEGLLYQRAASATGWRPMLTDEVINDSAAWFIEFNAQKGMYMFKNVATGKYLTHSAGGTMVGLRAIAGSGKPGTTEQFQLMPDRTDVTVGAGTTKIKTHGYWFTWYDNGNKAMTANVFNTRNNFGPIAQTSFNYSDAATAQQWIIISEKELEKYQEAAIAVGIKPIESAETENDKRVTGIYSVDGRKLSTPQKGVNIIRYADETSKKIVVK